MPRPILLGPRLLSTYLIYVRQKGGLAARLNGLAQARGDGAGKTVFLEQCGYSQGSQTSAAAAGRFTQFMVLCDSPITMTHARSLCSLGSLVVLSALAGCSSSNAKDTHTTTAKPEFGAGQTWERLIEGSWTLGAGEEKTRFCVKKELTEDVYIKAIRPVHPKGTHHTLLTLGDGKIDCTTAVAQGLIYAAAIGSEGLELPEGVAMKLPKGMFLNLGLHLYNTSNEELAGTSAMEVVTMPKEDVKFESEALLAGPLGISLPPGKETTIQADCAITADQNIYALFPHMHQWGTHLKTVLTMSGEENVLHDSAFRFDEQVQLLLDPVLELHPGDNVHTECTYDNDTSRTITFGESSDTEMCFSVLFRYPKLGSAFCGGGGKPAGGDAGAVP